MFGRTHRSRASRTLAVLALLLASLVTPGCKPSSPPPQSAPPPPVVSAPPPSVPSAPPGPGKVVGGSNFNKLFPETSDGYKLVYTQEKKGFAMAELSKDGKKKAQLSISDVAANTEALNKYRASSKQISGYPVVSVGSQGTAALVGNRFQVQVRSASPDFTEQDRETWLGKFKLGELAQLVGGK
jgi:hypothetical protein